MNIYFVALVLFVTLNFSDVQSDDSEFVTLWVPKYAYEDKEYRVFVFPSNLKQPTEVALQFRKTPAGFTLQSGKAEKIEYGSTERNFGGESSLKFAMSLYRNVTGKNMQCSTSNLEVLPNRKTHLTFIQLDKPIYKPGDEVKFRILVVDKDLNPLHMNNIDVNVTDPFNRTIFRFDNLEHNYEGVFVEKFNLSSMTTLGDWKVQVAVDKKYHLAVWKGFAVQKYTLPLFDAYIDLNKIHLLQTDKLTVSVYAKYSFDEFVKGNAELIIRRADRLQEYSRETIKDIQDAKSVTYSLSSIGIETNDDIMLEAFVTFTELESGLKFNKSAIFWAHHDKRHRIEVSHPPTFQPGFPFTVITVVSDWKFDRVIDHYEEVELTYLYYLDNGTNGKIMRYGSLKNGAYVDEFDVPSNYIKLSVECKFIDSNTYRKDVKIGDINVVVNGLEVSHSPEIPKLGDYVEVFIKSDIPLGDVLLTAVTRYGNTEIRQLNCENQYQCETEIDISPIMMPETTIVAYFVKDGYNIFQGKTNFTTENLGANSLTLDLPSSPVKTKQDINMKFTTKKKSKVYVLAFDKRLKYLKDGNDISKKDVIESVTDYDGENMIKVDHMTSWHDCTQEEIERIVEGRLYIGQQSGDILYPKEDDDDITDHNEQMPPSGGDSPSPDDLLREYFPETWIFDTLSLGSETSIEKTYKTPDSITTWLISAFSVHKDYGIALVPTQELVVKEEFFVKLNLPYSIRYKEVLQLDILTYNYLKTNEPLDVTVTVKNLNSGNEFQFVKYQSSGDKCNPTYSNDPELSTKVTVPTLGVKKTFFYIRSNPSDNKFDENEDKTIRIQVFIEAQDKQGLTHTDAIQKKLKIEPVGIRTYKVSASSYKLDGEVKRYKQSANHTEGLTSIDVIVTGDYLSDRISLDDKFEQNAYECLEQKTSRFKRNTATYQFLIAKGKSPSKTYFSNEFQAILDKQAQGYSYYKHTWYRSYYCNALATAMKAGLIPVDKQAVIKELDFLKDHQISNGTFSEFNFYYLQLPNFGNEFVERFYSTSYVLIPFLRHRRYVERDYSEVVEKAFGYLNKKENRLHVTNDGLSIAAYAYALDGNVNEAKTLLDTVEEASYDDGDGKKCYKIYRKDADCDHMHTISVALAYITLNNTAQAEPIVTWIMQASPQYGYMAHSYGDAITAEVICEMGLAMRSEITNFQVTLQNEHDFSTTVEMTKDNVEYPQEVVFPQYSQDVTTVATGKGYCTISIVFERIVIIPEVTSLFKVTIDPNVPSAQNEKTIKVCAKYDSKGADQPVLVNVIYEIALPSGYIYSRMGNISNKSSLKQISPRKSDTFLVLYYNDFKEKTDYCVEVIATKVFDVNDARDSSIKVYDFNNKKNVYIDFYKLKSHDCNGRR